MSYMRDREVTINGEKWFIGISSHFMERVRERCGNEVAIDDVIHGLANGYIIREKKNSTYTDLRTSIKVLCKVPFARSKLKEPYYILVLSMKPFKKMTLTTIYPPWFDNIEQGRYLLQDMNEKKIYEFIDLTIKPKQDMVMA